MITQKNICLAAILIATLGIGIVLDRLYFWTILVGAMLCWAITSYLIPKLSSYMIKANVFGYDINKKSSEAG